MMSKQHCCLCHNEILEGSRYYELLGGTYHYGEFINEYGEEDSGADLDTDYSGKLICLACIPDTDN